MATYAYISHDEINNKSTQEAIQDYLDQQDITVDEIVEQTKSTKHEWNRREIGVLVNDTAQKGDTIIIYEAADIARSTSQMLEILMTATTRNVSIHFVKYDQTFHAKKINKLADLLQIMQNIESDFISRRTTDALARRRAQGLPLGRPKGRKNKSLKLDKQKKDIVKYLGLNISKASIAKLVGCHPQTLYDWIDRNGLDKPEVKQTVKATVKEVETV